MAKTTKRSTGSGLSPTLKALVRVVEAALGEVVAEVEGAAVFEAVESVRKHMVAFRSADGAGQTRALKQASAQLEGLRPKQRDALARAYTLYLELVNVCENAYRTSRLRSRPQVKSAQGSRLVWVLTAHPTESRSPENIRVLRRLQDVLVDALERKVTPDAERIKHLLHLVWRVGTHPPHKPTVEDEAYHLFSLLSDPILDTLVELRQEGHEVRFRTWVGGDKDGHPGVGPEQTSASLNLSRQRLMTYLSRRVLPELGEDVGLLGDEALLKAHTRLLQLLEGLKRVDAGDGARLVALGRALRVLQDRYGRHGGQAHPALVRLEQLLGMFPGLVVPLELREERGEFGRRSRIAQMLAALHEVAQGGTLEWYVRGCVVSMTDRAEDLLEAQRLIERVAGPRKLPVIPLFELPSVLPRGAEILEGALADPEYKATIERFGLEVMLGYSDTAKRMGVLASRLAIHDTLNELGQWARERELPIVFFQGSGGSVGRGGGTFEEQAAGWPPEALAIVKQTLQGEMVERTLASPEILRSQVAKVAAVQAKPPKFTKAGDLGRALGEASHAGFAEVVGSEPFYELLSAATPYTRLRALNIGSRPTKRAGGSGPTSLEGLRAIPWVLCWTQTRLLLPAWLGIGTAWRRLRKDPKVVKQLRKELERDPLLRSYVRLLGFTLAKVEPRIWLEYRRQLAPKVAERLAKKLERELADARDFVTQANASGELLPDRAWLAESIFFRAPMIHPLNLLQIVALQEERPSQQGEALFRETVTGVAAGMLTTG